MRLLALVLAVALWFVAAEETGVRQPEVEERVVPAVVRLVGVSNGLVVVEKAGSVDVHLRVPAGAGVPEQLEAVADLSGRAAGVHQVPVTVSVPARFSVARVDPEQVKVGLEREVQRSFAVEIAVVGLPVGQAVAAGDPVPDVVTLSGAESRIARVRRVFAVVVYDRDSVTQTASVRSIDETGDDVSGITIRPQQVKVTLAPTLAPATPTEGRERAQPPLDTGAGGTDRLEPVAPPPVTGPVPGKQPAPAGQPAAATMVPAL